MYLRQIERHIQVMINKVGILFRIKHLQKGGQWITVDPGRLPMTLCNEKLFFKKAKTQYHLVNFVEEKDWVIDTNGF